MPLAERVTERIETLDGARGRADTQHRHPYETPELYEQIQAHCAACGKDVSAVTREIWQKEILHPAFDPSRVMLRLFVCTFEGLLRLGDRFTVEQFRQICAASLKGHVSQADLDKILEPSIVKQNPVRTST
jgi:hypothetical protein